MAVTKRVVGYLTAPFEIATVGTIDITSTDVNAQDEIIPSQKLGALLSSKATIQVTESNNKQVRIQPWASLNGSNWVPIPYASNQNHWVLPANDSDIVYIKDSLMFLYFKLTGYLATAGTAKVIAIGLFK